MNKKFYITTPIYYPNSNLHIGHTYTTILCDAFKGFQLLNNNECYFLTGSDEHGQKIEQSALAQKTVPKKYVDGIVDSFKNLWKLCDIDYNKFIRTTDIDHKKSVQDIFNFLYKKDLIYKDHYEGNYCISCEESFTDFQLINKTQCPLCGRDTIKQKEETYFFKMSEFKNWIKEIFLSNKIDIIPSDRKTELINNFINELQDLSISRTNFNWGIEVPNDKKHIIYVWIDALSNYITALGYPDGELFKKFWSQDTEIIHVIGKEITRFHCIYWPIILKSLNLRLPSKIISHGWIILDNEKMSKSKGNIVDPLKLINEFNSADPLRFYLLRNIKINKDGNYSYDLFKSVYNNDLANNIGNLHSRFISMVKKYYQGKFPKLINNKSSDIFIKKINDIKNNSHKLIGVLDFQKYIEEILRFADFCNKYIEDSKPWEMVKNNRLDDLSDLLANIGNSLYAIFLFLSPIIKESSKSFIQDFSLKSFEWSKLTDFNKLENNNISRTKILFERKK